MPSLEQSVNRETGKPREISSTITYYPGDEQTLRDGEMIAGIPDHWGSDGGYFRPDPDADGDVFIKVYIKSYVRDDSNPSAKKRHIVEVEIPGYAFRRKEA